ncbi:hypothetical protein BJ875DRAFT_286232 [Amylocarpus encephaloides]|uniref:FAD-binding domain-containing protein n=1 Tax=Amylocarpus encephaloides TaxID=45428 RepID=A0A9P7YTE9_9HELO|nr:hypothetical protein BJ875DRAFT_286232 [Amylocarpus encephaloides]
METTRPQEFTAIIVGGSVAGLTLAHCFARANINYVLLEARESLAPQLGAGIVIMPNGCRILDQIGILDPMRKFMTRMAMQYRRRSSGEVVGAADWPKLVEDRLGYPCGIAQRQLLLRSLHDQLEDKSKIVLQKKVVRIQHEPGSVTVKCQDGSEVVGHIVVGADGIHSKIRNEMQRIADEEGPSGMMDKDKTRVTAEYNAIFGISAPIDTLSPGDGHVASDIDHSGLVFVSNQALPQWFFFSKLDKRYQEKDIPRFTKEELEKQVEEFSDFHFTENVTLGDLMKTTTALSYVPLEEASHEFWTYKRVVCVGDSIHKMTPNMGQGGNQAIESAATLTNCLLELLSTSTTSHPSEADLATTLTKYQDLRKGRAEMFVKLSNLVTRDESLATLRHVLRFLYYPPLNSKQYAGKRTSVCLKEGIC